MIFITQQELKRIFDFTNQRKTRLINWIDTLDFLMQRQLEVFYADEGVRRRNNKDLTFEDRLCRSTYLDDRLGNYVLVYEQGSANISVVNESFLVSQALRIVVMTTCDNISELCFGLVRLLQREQTESWAINTNKEEVYRELSGKETNNNAVNLAYIDFTLQYQTDYDCREYLCKKC